MIKLQKIINIVKKGSFLYNSFDVKNSFNLRKKKANAVQEQEVEEFYKLHPELREGVEGITPVPSTIPVSQPSIPIKPVSEEIEERMDLWIESNKREIMEENKYDVTDLIKKKNEFPSESYLAPDPVLYRALKDNPVYQNYLIDKISSQFPGMNRDKASLFVETMMMKTMGLMEGIEERERQISKSEEKVRIEQERLKQQKEQDPYGESIPLKDPKLDMQAQELYYNLDINQQVKSLENWGYPVASMPRDKNEFVEIYQAMTGKATQNRLGSPLRSNKDQRMNFFLRYPYHISSIIQSDPQFERILREELKRVGIDENNVEDGLRKAYHLTVNKQRILNVLNNEKGQELYIKLSELINNFDPSLSDWLKNDIFDIYKEKGSVSYMQQGDEEGDMVSNLSGITSRDVSKLSVSEADMDETSKQIAAVTKTYLKDNLDDMKYLYTESIKKMMEENINKLKELEEKKKISPQDKNIEIEERRILNEYSIGEKLNAFSKSVLEQLDALFTVRGRANREMDKIIYKNQFGRVIIPLTDSKEIFGVGKKEEIRDISDYEGYVEDYKRRIESGEIKVPYNPIWKKMLNYRLPFKAYNNLAEMKKKIKDMYHNREKIIKDMGVYDKKDEQKKIIEEMTSIILNHSRENPRDALLLREFSNVTDNDNPSLVRKKIEDFIYMSVKQSPTNLKTIYKAHDDYARIQKKRNKLPKDPDKRKNREKEIINEEERYIHSLKTNTGDLYSYILPHTANLASQKIFKTDKDGEKIEVNRFSDRSLRAFADLFDHHPSKLRDLLNPSDPSHQGKIINQNDEHRRTNTELYYMAKREKPPSQVQALYDIYIDELELKKKIRGKGKKKISPTKNELWYKNFFDKYEKFEEKQRNLEIVELKIEKKQKNIKQYIHKVNNKAIEIISDKRGFEKIKNKIEDLNKRIEFDEIIRQWDGIAQLPSDFYTLLGQKKPIELLSKHNEEINNLERNLVDTKKDLEILKKKLKRTLSLSDYKYHLPALKLASIFYNMTMNKIYKLRQMKKSCYKFASINSNFINIAIENIKIEYDNLFRKLLL